mmetsp:Transcript_65606/g.170394  ORF Transcript_65606/g.170394 Transcript_65606/m.170394 type:complete len:517 (-) Transcript_65606:1375-2925(-)
MQQHRSLPQILCALRLQQELIVGVQRLHWNITIDLRAALVLVAHLLEAPPATAWCPRPSADRAHDHDEATSHGQGGDPHMLQALPDHDHLIVQRLELPLEGRCHHLVISIDGGAPKNLVQMPADHGAAVDAAPLLLLVLPTPLPIEKPCLAIVEILLERRGLVVPPATNLLVETTPSLLALRPAFSPRCSPELAIEGLCSRGLLASEALRRTTPLLLLSGPIVPLSEALVAIEFFMLRASEVASPCFRIAAAPRPVLATPLRFRLRPVLRQTSVAIVSASCSWDCCITDRGRSAASASSAVVIAAPLRPRHSPRFCPVLVALKAVIPLRDGGVVGRAASAVVFATPLRLCRRPSCMPLEVTGKAIVVFLLVHLFVLHWAAFLPVLAAPSNLGLRPLGEPSAGAIVRLCLGHSLEGHPHGLRGRLRLRLRGAAGSRRPRHRHRHRRRGLRRATSSLVTATPTPVLMGPTLLSLIYILRAIEALRGRRGLNPCGRRGRLGSRSCGGDRRGSRLRSGRG